MQGIRLVRRLGACEEEYGRIIFDGGKIRYKGLTCIFQKHLSQGVTGPDKNKRCPQDGLLFLDSLKYHFKDGPLKAADL